MAKSDISKNGYDHVVVEKGMRNLWEKEGVYSTPDHVNKDDKYYILPQLPYPSGSGLHVGHAEVYTSCDIYARFQRMQGKKVLQVIGWDAFGLPAENYAIKTNIHPRINTDKAIDTFREQIKRMGVSVDWEREVGSHNPDYYKWTQWFFKLMYDQGLAYRKKQAVNWCDSCKTVLANEQVVDGACERCDTEVLQKELEQWFLRITDYADRLVHDLDKVDWPEETIKRQKDWIGRSEGMFIDFSTSEGDEFRVFTTAQDTIFGLTYIVFSPEHELVKSLSKQSNNSKEIDSYIKNSLKKTELERQQQKEKTGVLVDGVTVRHPLIDRDLPVYVADYVLKDYGTGIVMGVPGHDERDFEFAKKYKLEIIFLTEDSEFINYTKDIKDNSDQYFLINSGEFDKLSFKEAKKKITEKLEKEGLGQRTIQYKLRDWSVSRQRFWGAPIPMLYRNAKDKIYKEKPDFVLNLHAWDSSSEEHYHPWIEKELKNLNIESSCPNLSDPRFPKFSEWLNIIRGEVEDKENVVITARSLSVWSALKYAEENKVRKLVLIGPVLGNDSFKKRNSELKMSDKIRESILDFVYKNEIDLKKVIDNVGEIVFMISKDDKYIPFTETEEFIRTNFPFARIIRFREAGHFSKDRGFTEFPQLLNEIIDEVRGDLVPVMNSDLPVILPDDVDFKPTGQSPLTYSEKFQSGVEDKYEKGFKREVDTLDTFMCSSWYYFRYLDPKNEDAFASEESLKTWMPVDFYIGGPEHVNGHLLYSRFFTKVLYDAGYIDFDEPFSFHRHQGLILAEDGRKMSKRWGNVINPNDVIDEYGADTLRVYEMFMGPLEQTKAWSDDAVKGVRRFLSRIYDYSLKYKDVNLKKEDDDGILFEINNLVKSITKKTADLRFNTAISDFMKFMNFIEKKPELITEDSWKKFLRLLAPYAPFLTDFIWREVFGGLKTIHIEMWPEFSKKLAELSMITIAVQINGKTRGEVEISVDADEEEVKFEVEKDDKLLRYLQDEPKKVIYVKGRIINYII